MTIKVYSVSEITSRIKDRIESDGILSNATIRGEISNFKLHSSGHAYFSLKDKGAVIRVVMFRGNFSRVVFRPQDGMEVNITGRVSVYEKDGSYQLYADFMTLGGQGALAKAFEDLKKKLENEGLFDKDIKKPIPYFPNTVGVITSETGAAVRDVMKVLRQRCPIVNILLYPVQVQGTKSAPDIQKAIRWFNENGKADVIILGRGGGSMEELWSFNEEIVARSIAASDIPIISAVGHETDFTIADFVADLRAATPSNAAELAVPELRSINRKIEDSAFRLENSIMKDFKNYKEKIGWNAKSINRAMERYLLNKGAGFTKADSKLDSFMSSYLNKTEKKLVAANSRLEDLVKDEINKNRMSVLLGAERLEALNPEKILKLGYSIVEKNKKIVSSIENIELNDRLNIRFTDGVAVGRIEEVKKNGS